jgi:hypothetical protein
MKQLSILLTFICLAGYAQPNTEIYLFDLSEDGISNPTNISNNEGYDNQPSFWSDNGSILYARTVNGQTEIARYFISSKETIIISNTPQGGEYSPLKIPGDEAISAIRLDTTGLQLLYRYDLKGDWTVAVPDLKIGYHAWINSFELISYVLGEPATLQRINMSTGQVKILRTNIGRSLHKIPNSDGMSFMDQSVKPWKIYRLNPVSGAAKEICVVNGENEDYCWTSDGAILMGRDNKLIKYTTKNGWQPFADLSTFELTGSISRMATSPDGKQLTIVISI